MKGPKVTANSTSTDYAKTPNAKEAGSQQGHGMGQVLLFSLSAAEEAIEEQPINWDNVNGYNRDKQLDLINDSSLYRIARCSPGAVVYVLETTL